LASCLNIEPKIELVGMQVSDVPLTCASDQKLISYIGEWPETSLQNGLVKMTEWLERWSPIHQPH